MAITGENIHDFQYVDFGYQSVPFEIKEFLTRKLEDVESKHVASKKEETAAFFQCSQKVGYPNTVLGIHRNSNIRNEFFRIQNMSRSLCQRAVRFAICSDGKIWSDNTHWTLAYLLKKGANISVSEIPAYIIDFRGNHPIVYDKNNVVFDSVSDIKSAIASAKRIQERLDLGWRPIELSYTIKQLKKDIISVVNEEDSLDV